MDGSASTFAILIRAALILPAVIAVAGADLTKYRAWRERCARWRFRVAGLAVAAGGFGFLTLYLFGGGGLNPRIIWPLYAVTMVGAGIWGLLKPWVR